MRAEQSRAETNAHDMETHDDRPISVYDNLNVPNATTTTTAATTQGNVTKIIAKPTPPTMSMTSAPTTTAPVAALTATSAASAADMSSNMGNAYADITFKFNDNNKTPAKQQQQHQHHKCSPERQQQQQHQQIQVQANPQNATVHYATPFKSNTVTAATATTTTTLPSIAIASASTSTATATPASASEQQRPLSQHSQSELNATTSQNIAAVKAALNDAKSKFFGLNGLNSTLPTSSTPSRDQPINFNNIDNYSPSTPFVNVGDIETTPHNKPKVQIVSPSKSQPKYQNIPENSAIYRQQQQRPELPPKPNYLINRIDRAESPTNSNTAAARTTPSPVTTTNMSSAYSPAAQTTGDRSSPSKSLAYGSTYKQIPLNDIESSQPSQAVYMATTVPQNIKGSKIAGRHTPTRNSLRHSRMLVVNNKNYRATEHPNPMNFKYPNLARWLLIMQLLIGVLIICLSIWIFFLSPSTAIQDNPYWTGLALLFAGILGLVLVRYQRIERNRVRENCFRFLRADTYFLALLALLLCAVALVCACIHHARLTAPDTHCESTNILLEHGSCTCTFNAPPTIANQTTSIPDALEAINNGEELNEVDDRSYKVEYRDLSCSELHCEWLYILVLSIALNLFGFIVSLLYTVSLACGRHDSKRFYASVHTSTF